jgi:E3 ubiquitin-protein ligase EDD1
MASTCSSLTRAFGIVIRQIADLLTMLQDYAALAPTLPRTLEIGYQEAVSLQLMIEGQMKPNWDWLMTILDSTEAQLRFGSALSSITESSAGGVGGGGPANHTGGVGGAAGGSGANSLVRAARTGGAAADSHRLGYAGAGRAGGLISSASSDPLANRRDFLNYALSLMRAHNSEHSDSLPVLDVSALKHVAYVFDALIYYMRSGTEEARGGRSADGGGGVGSFAALYTPLETDDEEGRDQEDVDEIPLGLGVGDRSASGGGGGVDAMETESGDEEAAAPPLPSSQAAQGTVRCHDRQRVAIFL